MKALSIHPYYAMGIVVGDKTIECRTWSTEYRGDILICSTAHKVHGTIPGHALGVVKLVDVRPFTKNDCEAAMMEKKDYKSGMFAWVLDDNRIIKPVPVKGRLGLWNYDGEIEIIPDEETLITDDMTDEEAAALESVFIEKYWKDIMI